MPTFEQLFNNMGFGYGGGMPGTLNAQPRWWETPQAAAPATNPIQDVAPDASAMPPNASLTQGQQGLGQPAGGGGFLAGLGANRNALVGMGLGLMGGGNQWNKFAGAQEGYQQGTRADLAAAQQAETAKQHAISNALQQQQLALTGDIKEYQYAKQQGYQGSFQDWMAIKQQQQNKAGLNPTYYYTTGPNGERVLNIGQLQTGGGLHPVQLPPGAVLADPSTQYLDTGTGFVPVSKRPPAGTVPGAAGTPDVPGAAPAQPAADAGGVIQKNIIGREEQEQIGTGYGKEFTQFQNDAIAAQRMNSTLTRLKQLSPNVFEGSAGPAFQQARSLLTSFGIPSDKVAAGDEFNALSNKIVLDAAGGSLGTGFSNADRDFLASTVPVMSQSAQGRMQLIDTLQKINQRKIETAKQAREYRKKNGNMEGFPEAMAAYSDANPLFPEAPQGGGGGNQPQAEQTKVVNGKTYYKRNGKWYDQ